MITYILTSRSDFWCSKRAYLDLPTCPKVCDSLLVISKAHKRPCLPFVNINVARIAKSFLNI